MLFLVLAYAACAIVVLLDIGALILVVIGWLKIIREFRDSVATEDNQDSSSKTDAPRE